MGKKNKPGRKCRSCQKRFWARPLPFSGTCSLECLAKRRELLAAKARLPKKMARWDHCEQIKQFFGAMLIPVHVFANPSTPHMRIMDIDYWPATSRFYDLSTGLKGRGETEFKTLVLSKSAAHTLDQQMYSAMERDGD